MRIQRQIIAALFLLPGLFTTPTAGAEPPVKGSTPVQAPKPASAQPGTAIKRGEPLSAAPAIAVEDCAAKAKELHGKQIKITAKVNSVCQKKGCWMVLQGKDPEQMIRVRFKDYAFFVPKDIAGRQVTAEGMLSVKMLDIETAQHYEDDKAEGTGKPAKKISAPVAELELMAAGVEIEAN